MSRSSLPSLARGTARFDSAVLGAALYLCFASKVQAEQFVVADVTYTHSGATTEDSHYRVPPAPGSPTNWASPVNYAGGSVHVLLEVKTKPTKTPTKFQVCFEATPSYACTSQLDPAYTDIGTYKWTTPFDKFYYDSTVDWTKGTKKIALILKDTSNGKPQGDPNYVPTDLRVEVTLLSPGASYAAPPLPRDAGVPADAGPKPSDAGIRPSDAGNTPIEAGSDAGGDAGTRAPIDASTPPAPDASTTTPVKDAGGVSVRPDASTTPTGDAGKTADAGSGGEEEDEGSDSGCSLATRSSSYSGLLMLVAVGLLSARRRRRSSLRELD